MKKIIVFMLSICISFCGVMPVYANETVVNSKSSILLEPTTNTILLENNAKEKMPIASVTKVMTMLLIFEAIDDAKIKKDDVVTVSEHAAGMGGSQVYLEPMEQQTVDSLIKCIAVSSANDASVAMAEYIAGSEQEFVNMMNEKAKQLGMTNTNFVNACGLDDDNGYSCAFDVAIMSRELIINHPDVFNYTGIWQDEIVHKTARGEEPFGLANTNKLIKNYSGATGLKTGSTSKAMFCLSGTAERDGMQLVAVVLGANTPSDRVSEVIKMLDYGFANYTVQQIDSVDTPIATININNAENEDVKLYVKENKNIVIDKNNKSEVTKEAYVINNLTAPIAKGTKAGEIVYKQNGEIVTKVDLIVVEDVVKASFEKNVKKVLEAWL